MEEILRGTSFSPHLETPIKTLDLPFAGRGYGSNALPLIFDLVGIATDDVGSKVRKVADDAALEADVDGAKTQIALKMVKRLVQRITGTSPGSLGLHPALYVYGRSGNHQPTAFLGLVSFIKDIESKGRLDLFATQRGSFEKFLLENRGIISAVVHKLGSGPRSVPKVVELYNRVLDFTDHGMDSKQILDALEGDDDFKFLSLLRVDGASSEVTDEEGTNFSRNAKSAVFLNSALGSPNLCPICGGLMHKNSMTVDHVVRKADGGLGSVSNGQMAHPYCNTTVKN